MRRVALSSTWASIGCVCDISRCGRSVHSWERWPSRGALCQLRPRPFLSRWNHRRYYDRRMGRVDRLAPPASPLGTVRTAAPKPSCVGIGGCDAPRNESFRKCRVCPPRALARGSRPAAGGLVSSQRGGRSSERNVGLPGPRGPSGTRGPVVGGGLFPGTALPAMGPLVGTAQMGPHGIGARICRGPRECRWHIPVCSGRHAFVRTGP